MNQRSDMKSVKVRLVNDAGETVRTIRLGALGLRPVLETVRLQAAMMALNVEVDYGEMDRRPTQKSTSHHDDAGLGESE